MDLLLKQVQCYFFSLAISRLLVCSTYCSVVAQTFGSICDTALTFEEQRVVY